MSVSIGRRVGRFIGIAATAFVMLSVFAPSASADGAGPTNYESRIDSIKPTVKGVRIEVLGSEAFLQVSAEPGVRVQIPGYDGEPYLRIDADGSVWQNRNSPAKYVNTSRSGRTTLPTDLGDGNDPKWEKVSDDGTVAWHDHRIHWMTNETPAADANGFVQEWEVPITVDGTEVLVTGSLYRKGNALPWPALVSIAAAAAIAIAVARSQIRFVSPVLIAVSVIALLQTLIMRAGDPPGSGTSPVPLILAVLALGCALVSLIPKLGLPIVGLATTLASAALLIGWLVPVIGVFWMPYVPLGLPAVVSRLLVAAVAGGALGSAIATVLDPDSVRPRAH
ncbi:MAG: hypothetical protein KDB26_04430 [Microthrixaceae bacterium]|nr:hypothetical protein [Microthrixaceae bacterium]